MHTPLFCIHRQSNLEGKAREQRFSLYTLLFLCIVYSYFFFFFSVFWIQPATVQWQ